MKQNQLSEIARQHAYLTEMNRRSQSIQENMMKYAEAVIPDELERKRQQVSKEQQAIATY